MDRRWVAGAVALALVGAGLSGCRQEGAAPVSSTAASPTKGSSPASSSAIPSDTSTSPTPSEDPLFTEAKQVHLEYLEQMILMDQAGGKDAPSEEMRSLVTGEFEETLDAVYAKLRTANMHAEKDAKWHRISIRQVPAEHGHAVGISACVDFSKIRYLNSDGTVVSRGSIRRDNLQLDREAGKLVISEGFSDAVKSCSA